MVCNALKGCDVYLKQIELENFKSFGGKLTIPLMEGYMAVTGPNGSGKSNITDAILFVLGPKSSKAVRAGRLTDLIFDGGKSKNRASFMKVSLVFDNTDRLMPWDDDTVRLMRYVKVSNNGTDYNSYFFVNDQKSSLTEFDNLLMKARISADGYNMVQQGDVTRIVQMGNMDRRRLLDSISGIASYDADIEKAGAERQEAQANLERISIIVNELKTQLDRLEKDREDAKRYMAVQADMEMAKAQLVHRRHQMEESKLRGIREAMVKLEGEISSLKAKKDDLRTQYDLNETAIHDKENEIASRIGPEYKEIKKKIEDAKVLLATQRDRIERLNDDISEQQTFKVGFEESISDNRKEYDTVCEAMKDVVMGLEESIKDLEDAKAEDFKLSDEMSRKGGEYAGLQSKLNDLDKSIDVMEAKEQSAQVSLAKAETVDEENNRSKAHLEERLQSSTFEIKDAEWNLQQIKQETESGSVEEFSRKILSSRKEEAELEKQESELREAVRSLESEYNQLSAEKRVSDKFNGGNIAVKEILAMRDKGEMAGIHGTIQELATVDTGYETALSIAAGGKMQAVVVDNDQVASDCIAYLKKQKLGRVSFLPLNKMVGGKPRAKAIMVLKQTEGYATDLIDYDPKYSNAFWYVFQDTLVVGNLETARGLMGGVRLVTMAGELIEASGAMVGGTISKQSVMKFGSSSESRLEEVGSKLRGANAALDSLVARLREIRNGIRALDDEMRNASSVSAGSQAKMGQLNAQLNELKKARKSVLEQLEAKKAECELSNKVLQDAKEDLGGVLEALEALRVERSTVKDRMSEIAPADMQDRIQHLRDRIYQAREKVSDLSSQKAVMLTEISGLDAQLDSLRSQLSLVDRKIGDDERILSESAAACERTTVDLEALKNIEREMESSIEGLRNEKDSLMERKYSLDSQICSIQDKIEVDAGMRSSQEAQTVLVMDAIQQLKAEIDTLTVEVDLPLPPEDDLRRTVRSCENTISRLGNVNLRAIEEYEERRVRYDALQTDMSSLLKQVDDLDRLTDSLNSKKKGLFMQSYHAVNTNFKSIYGQLSGGGEAFMDLDDEDDPFNGGLSINAKPRNGKLLRLEALSGGEKSLTALAFIFAIQEYQPSPFYVLDEVDMFLDAVNAEMVARRVKESSQRAQFIQVSLRKVTLAMADHLIGVTRPPSGVSKVIMQPDFDEVAKYEEQAIKEQHQD